MGQRVELIISCINDTRKAIQEVTSSFQSVVIKFAAWNHSITYAFQRVQHVLDVAVLKAARVGDDLYKMSQKIGIGVEELYWFSFYEPCGM
ncbi:MAG: hypothetical protein E3K36_07375 [Candidatus Brocadia sp.]|nr:hypothetical protein [Candidatus Brocadia sp.]